MSSWRRVARRGGLAVPALLLVGSTARAAELLPLELDDALRGILEQPFGSLSRVRVIVAAQPGHLSSLRLVADDNPDRTWGRQIVWGDSWIGRLDGNHIVWRACTFDEQSAAWGNVSTGSTQAVNPLAMTSPQP